jgi:hypothetical protein
VRVARRAWLAAGIAASGLLLWAALTSRRGDDVYATAVDRQLTVNFATITRVAHAKHVTYTTSDLRHRVSEARWKYSRKLSNRALSAAWTRRIPGLRALMIKSDLALPRAWTAAAETEEAFHFLWISFNGPADPLDFCFGRLVEEQGQAIALARAAIYGNPQFPQTYLAFWPVASLPHDGRWNLVLPNSRRTVFSLQIKGAQ